MDLACCCIAVCTACLYSREASAGPKSSLHRSSQGHSPQLTRPLWCAGHSSPEKGAGWASSLLYSYCNGLLELGYSRPLEQSDLWALDKREQTSTVGAQFQEALKQTRDPVTAPHVRLSGTSQCGLGV